MYSRLAYCPAAAAAVVPRLTPPFHPSSAPYVQAGEAFSQAQLVVHVQATVTGDLGIPEQQQYIQSVEQLEAYKQAIQKQVRPTAGHSFTPHPGRR